MRTPNQTLITNLTVRPYVVAPKPGRSGFDPPGDRARRIGATSRRPLNWMG